MHLVTFLRFSFPGASIFIKLRMHLVKLRVTDAETAKYELKKEIGRH